MEELDREFEAETPSRWNWFWALGFSFLLACAFVVAQTAAVIAFVIREMVVDPKVNIETLTTQLQSNGLALTASAFAALLVCVPLAIVMTWTREGRPLAFLGFRSVSLRTLMLWLGAAIAFAIVSDGVTLALGRPVVPPFMKQALATAGHPVLLLAALVVAAPLLEEILFRGFWMSALAAAGAPTAVGAVTGALLWAVIHIQYDFYGVATIFVLGLLLAAARIQSQSLIPCLAMHALLNAIAFTQAMLLRDAWNARLLRLRPTVGRLSQSASRQGFELFQVFFAVAEMVGQFV
jgi:membrane protease YdiL (CAAX protease family)